MMWKLLIKQKFPFRRFDRCWTRLYWSSVYFFAVSITQFFSHWTYGFCRETSVLLKPPGLVKALAVSWLSSNKNWLQEKDFFKLKQKFSHYFLIDWAWEVSELSGYFHWPYTFMSWMWVWISFFLNVYYLSTMWKSVWMEVFLEFSMERGKFTTFKFRYNFCYTKYLLKCNKYIFRILFTIALWDKVLTLRISRIMCLHHWNIARRYCR